MPSNICMIIRIKCPPLFKTELKMKNPTKNRIYTEIISSVDKL